MLQGYPLFGLHRIPLFRGGGTIDWFPPLDTDGVCGIGTFLLWFHVSDQG